MVTFTHIDTIYLLKIEVILACISEIKKSDFIFSLYLLFPLFLSCCWFFCLFVLFLFSLLLLLFCSYYCSVWISQIGMHIENSISGQTFFCLFRNRQILSEIQRSVHMKDRRHTGQFKHKYKWEKREEVCTEINLHCIYLGLC